MVHALEPVADRQDLFVRELGAFPQGDPAVRARQSEGDTVERAASGVESSQDRIARCVTRAVSFTFGDRRLVDPLDALDRQLAGGRAQTAALADGGPPPAAKRQRYRAVSYARPQALLEQHRLTVPAVAVLNRRPYCRRYGSAGAQ